MIAARTFLYVPGDRPDRIAKAVATVADVVVIDLEDSVAPGSKAEARRALEAAATFDATGRLEVRVNGTEDSGWVDDIAAAIVAGVSSIRLPKVEDAAWVAEVGRAIDKLEAARGLGTGSIGLTCLIETALGVVSAGAIATASPRVRRLALGEQDLRRDLGLGEAAGTIETAASLIVLHSGAARLAAPLAPVYTRLDDDEGLRASTARYRDLGFGGRSCIHPSQLDTVRAAFDDRPDERAPQIVEAYEAALAVGRAATRLPDGTFIDRAVYERARHSQDPTRRVARKGDTP